MMEKPTDEIPYGYCQCGCGGKTNIATQTQKKYGWIKGEPLKFMLNHDKRKKDCDKIYYPKSRNCTDGKTHRKHVLIAEKVLGKKLPNKALVHHIDGDVRNYKNNNLIICQDDSFHRLIHMRTEALKACGNPNYRKCCFCGKWDSLDNLTKLRGRAACYHKSCNAKAAREYRKSKKQKVA